MRSNRPRLAALFVGLMCMAVVFVPYLALAQQGAFPPPNAGCTPSGQSPLVGQAYPGPGAPGTAGSTGGLEPENPIWCWTQSQAGAPTRLLDANSWVDSWDNDGPPIQTLNTGDYDYNVFQNFVAPPGTIKAGTFINTNHWMVDMVDISEFRLSGGVLVSPNRQFQFENGTFVVEVDAAAGGDGMGGANRFYEIDVTPAAAPTGVTVDSLYGYGAFGGVGAVGCRMERNDSGGNFVCAMYDDSSRATDSRCVLDDNLPVPPTRCPLPDVSGRKWETQGVGTSRTAASVSGNFANFLIPGGNGLHMGDVWRQCGANVHDLHCRDRCRMEITKDSIHLLVNGYLVFAIDGLFAVNPVEGWDNRIPDSWFDSGVRPYFTSWINGGQHTPSRWHWNDVRVNPRDADGAPSAPSASPSFCLGNTFNGSPNTCAHLHEPGVETIGGASSPTNTPLPTVEPSVTPTSESTATPTVEPTATLELTATPPPAATSTEVPVPTDTPTPSEPTSTPTSAPPTHTPAPEATATPTVGHAAHGPTECHGNNPACPTRTPKPGR